MYIHTYIQAGRECKTTSSGVGKRSQQKQVLSYTMYIHMQMHVCTSLYNTQRKTGLVGPDKLYKGSLEHTTTTLVIQWFQN